MDHTVPEGQVRRPTGKILCVAEEIYESRRLVLRERPGEPVVAQLAAAADWTLLADNRGEHYAQYTREQSWGVRNNLHVHVINDELSECCALSVISDNRGEAEQFRELLIQHLNPLTQDELLEPISDVTDPGERMLRMMRLALSAPAEFDREIHERVVRLAHDPDSRVRDATTLASCYLAWPEMRVMLAHLAAHDPDPRVRQDAANTLSTYDSSGVPH